MEVHFASEIAEKLAQSAAPQGHNPSELVEEVLVWVAHSSLLLA